MAASQKLDVKGKGAIVTGGGSGIALAFVKELYAAGCSVLIADLKLHSSAATWIDTLDESKSQRIAFQQTDVTKWAQLEGLFDVYEQDFGGTPYLVCTAAGLYEPSTNGFWDEKDTDDYYKLHAVNIGHPIRLSRIAIRRMLANDAPGVILHVSSTGAQKASIVTPLYQPSKHAISCFVRAMIPLEKLCGIRVVAVAPGPTGTPMLHESPGALKFFDLEKDILTPPKTVAEGMLAVSTELQYPTGTVLEVTGPRPEGWREVQMLNDPGPKNTAFFSKKDDAIKDIAAFLDADKRSGKHNASP